MKQTHRALALACCLLAPLAHADIFKCVEADGHVTYTNSKPANTKARDCTLMTKEQSVTTVPSARPAGAKSAPSPTSFPRVDTGTQRARDNDRRTILETEMATERNLLDAARKELAEQEAVRQGDERNYQKYLDRIQGYKDKVSLHERNIEALSKELSRLP